MFRSLSKRALFAHMAGTMTLAGTVLLITGGTAEAATRSAGTKPMPTKTMPAQIVSARTTQTGLGSSGGRLQVKGTVKHASTCQLKLLWAPAVTVVYSHNATPSCHGDNYSADVVVGPNRTTTVKTVAFQLVVRNGGSSATKTMYVTVTPKPASTTIKTPPTTSPPATTSTTVPVPTTAPATAPLTTLSPVNPVESSNWSGYTAYGGPFTGVTGTFTVPSVASANGHNATSEWVGVDGVDDTSLIQAGVLETGGPGAEGSVEIIPWWEELPADQTPITSMTVSAGDSVTVTIRQVSGTTWEISVVDRTNGQSFSTQQAYSGAGSSAEWVVEAPTDGISGRVVGLDSFGSPVMFTDLGTTGPVTSLDDDTLVQEGVAVATPTPIAANGFSVANTDIPLF